MQEPFRIKRAVKNALEYLKQESIDTATKVAEKTADEVSKKLTPPERQRPYRSLYQGPSYKSCRSYGSEKCFVCRKVGHFLKLKCVPTKFPKK